MKHDRHEKKRHESVGAGNGSAPAEDMDVIDRFEEAHQGLMGILFAAHRLHGSELKAEPGSLPLTIIGGFLGSGKTTLLNHLLVSPHGRRLVVLVNDFGKVNIDAELIASQTDDMINLTNGCACCAVSDDLTNNLIEIAERDEAPDGIVLEASGVADPNGIVMVALSNPAIRLDGSLVVVDAETMHDLAGDSLTRRLFHNQIHAADLIVVSKVDLIDEARRAEVKEWFATRYPEKRVVEAVKGDVPTELVLGIGTERDLQAEAPESTDHAHDFESFSFTIDEPLDGERLHAFLDSLPESLLRAKGVLNLVAEPSRRTIYQRVGPRWNLETSEPWGQEKPHSTLVLIGPRGLFDRSALEARLDACRSNSD